MISKVIKSTTRHLLADTKNDHNDQKNGESSNQMNLPLSLGWFH